MLARRSRAQDGTRLHKEIDLRLPPTEPANKMLHKLADHPRESGDPASRKTSASGAENFRHSAAPLRQYGDHFRSRHIAAEAGHLLSTRSWCRHSTVAPHRHRNRDGCSTVRSNRPGACQLKHFSANPSYATIRNPKAAGGAERKVEDAAANPRSVMRTSTDLLVARSVTRTLVPNGRLR
jgi:hypothetical protein